MLIDIVTIFPGFFVGPFQYGIPRRAQELGLLQIEIHDLRQFTEDRHRTVDDRPFGGEEGMVFKPEPLFRAVEHIIERNRERNKEQPGAPTGEKPRVILLSAQGKLLRQPMAAALSREQHLILLCGRYEGVDERVTENLATDEVSIGDFVLSGGELAAAVLTDTVARLLPGALGKEASTVRESFTSPPIEGRETRVGILDCPHYTRPAVFRELAVPEILLSGDHQRIEQWRRRKAFEKTWRNRPDLLNEALLDEEQQRWRAELEKSELAKPELAKDDAL